ncbi:hypothetical protein NADE_000790 [Nannochloris sp. 'desiccata']|nr:hypothetical protein NADE_000790 [Chlorella desiccata (nom. nud.)]
MGTQAPKNQGIKHNVKFNFREKLNWGGGHRGGQGAQAGSSPKTDVVESKTPDLDGAAPRPSSADAGARQALPSLAPFPAAVEGATSRLEEMQIPTTRRTGMFRKQNFRKNRLDLLNFTNRILIIEKHGITVPTDRV